LPNVPVDHDLCAHGGVLVTQDDRVLVDDRGENWTLSAAALFLLRSLVSDHTPQSRVGDQLFPCCGHAMYVQDASDDVVIVGCPRGRDWQVQHRAEKVVLVFEGERQVSIPEADWREAVLGFSDAVEAFYASCAEKQHLDPDEAAGYKAFRAEWRRRKDEARR